MREKILELQKAASALEPETEDQHRYRSQADDFVRRFYETIPHQKAYRRFDDSVDKLLDEPIGEEPIPSDEILHQVESRVVPPGLNPVSGGHMGYIPGGGLLTSAIGDYLAAATNRYASVYFSSPGAVVLETRLVRWMCDLVGYGDEAGGYLASGGSMANMTAVVAARDTAGLEPQQFSSVVVYMTRQAHHCVDRALNIAGLKSARRRFIGMDERYRMRTGELIEAIREDRKNGLKPWMVVANAGSTDTGVIDPLDEIAETARREELWFHVDAAYGGFFLLTDEGKSLLKGIGEADSVVLDPHKGLFLPYGLGALVIKERQNLAEAHSYSADYMQDARIDSKIPSPADISPELSRHFRGLRMWLPLKIHGVAAFRASLREKLLLAKYVWQELSQLEGFETGPEPDLSVIIFRCKPPGVDPDEFNRELHRRLVDDGRIFFSTTRINGQFMLRLAILSVRTHLGEIDLLLKLLREKMTEILEGGRAE